MLSWSLTFLVFALIAGLFGLSGIAGASAWIAKVLFVVFLVALVISLVSGYLSCLVLHRILRPRIGDVRAAAMLGRPSRVAAHSAVHRRTAWSGCGPR